MKTRWDQISTLVFI